MLSLNSSNCWETLRADRATAQAVMSNATAKNLSDWAISSKATERSAECSTTRDSNLNAKRKMKSPRMGSACLDQDYGYIAEMPCDRKFFLTKEELLQEYKNLKSTLKIAKKYGVSKKTVLVWMRNYDLSRRERKIDSRIVEAIKLGYSSTEISKKFSCSQSWVLKIANKFDLDLKNHYHKGYSITHHGYKTIFLNGKKVREHRLIAEKSFGIKLKNNQVVHHIDGDKLNNSPDNLEVMTLAEHTSLHHKGISKPKRVKI